MQKRIFSKKSTGSYGADIGQVYPRLNIKKTPAGRRWGVKHTGNHGVVPGLPVTPILIDIYKYLWKNASTILLWVVYNTGIHVPDLGDGLLDIRDSPDREERRYPKSVVTMKIRRPVQVLQ